MSSPEEILYSDQDNKYWIKWLFIPLSLIVVAVIFGNSLVILAALLNKSLQTPPNLYIISLAIVDLLVGVFILPFSIVQLTNDHAWNCALCGEALCGIWLTADIALCSLSIYHLIAIAVDRYRTVNEGLCYLQQRNCQSVCVTLAFLWIVALWISLPPALGWHKDDWGVVQIEDEHNVYKQVCILTNSQGYVLYSSLGTLFFPMFLMVLIYMKVYNKIKKRIERSNVRGFERTVEDGCATDSSEDLLETRKDETKNKKKLSFFRMNPLKEKVKESIDLNQSNDDQVSEEPEPTKDIVKKTKKVVKQPSSSQVQDFVQKKLKFSLCREQRDAKTLGIIICTFLLCWLPFSTLYIIDAFLPYQYKANGVWFDTFTWLGYLNSALNPIIYSIYDKDFKEAFRKLMPCLFRK